MKNLFLLSLSSLLLLHSSAISESLSSADLTSIDVFENNEPIPTAADVAPLPKVEIPLVTIDDPNNDPDPSNGLGRVRRVFQMGKYDVTAAQYCVFLNAVATSSDPYHLYSRKMEFDTEVATIKRTKENGRYHYEVIQGRGDCPITYITWLSAARFCNWLHHGQPVGKEGSETTETGAYSLNGALYEVIRENTLLIPQPGARYYLPSANQWYKAAFYKRGGRHAGYWLYPTRHDTPPGNMLNSWFFQDNQINCFIPLLWDIDNDSWDESFVLTPVGAFEKTTSPYGLYDMGGNVKQWVVTRCTNLEHDDDEPLFLPAHFGGCWDNPPRSRHHYDMIDNKYPSLFIWFHGHNTIGFRVAAPAKRK